MIKETFKKFLTYGVGSILQSSLGIILLPLYLRFFTPEDYGVISVLTVMLSLCSLFASAGVVNGMIRLYYEKEGYWRRLLVGNTWLWFLVVGLLGWVLLQFQAPLVSRLLFRTEVQSHSISLVGLIFLFSMAKNVPLYVLRLEEKAGMYIFFSIFSFLADFGLKLYFIVILNRGIYGYLESGAISNFLTLIFMLPFVAKYSKFSLNIPLIKQILRLGIPYIFSGLAIWMLDSSDRFLLARFSGEAAVGIYSLAFQFSAVFTILLAAPVSLLLDPFFFAYAANKTASETDYLLQRLLSYTTIAGGFVYLMIALGSADILQTMVKYLGVNNKYSEAIWLVPITTLVPYLYFIAISGALAALLIKKPEIASVATVVAALINVVANLLIIPIYGAMGASVTKVICYLVLNIVVYWQIVRIHPIQYDWKRTVLSFSGLLMMIVIIMQIRLAEPLWSFVLRVGLGLLIWTAFVFLVKGILTNHERETIMLYLARSKQRLFCKI
jgi:O-antigen/teichoic acid export membrane protein